jgi:hypothetical protein
MQQHTVTVTIFGKDYTVTVFEFSGRWYAEGGCEGQFLKGRSAKSFQGAVKNWEQLARMHLDH